MSYIYIYINIIFNIVSNAGWKIPNDQWFVFIGSARPWVLGSNCKPFAEWGSAR